MKNVLKIVLLVLAIALSYFIYRSVQGLVEFNEVKMERYADAVTQLEDIASAERLYKGYYGGYTDNIDSLKTYINEGKIIIINRRDSSAYVRDNRTGIDVMKSFTIMDTIISPVSVKDSIFGQKSLDNFGYVNIEEKQIPIQLWASFRDRIVAEDSTNVQRDHFFKAWVNKKDVLAGLGEDYIARELVDETSPIKGEVIQVGSDSRPSLEGNWSSDIDAVLKERRNALTNQAN